MMPLVLLMMSKVAKSPKAPLMKLVASHSIPTFSSARLSICPLSSIIFDLVPFNFWRKSFSRLKTHRGNMKTCIPLCFARMIRHAANPASKDASPPALTASWLGCQSSHPLKEIPLTNKFHETPDIFQLTCELSCNPVTLRLFLCVYFELS